MKVYLLLSLIILSTCVWKGWIRFIFPTNTNGQVGKEKTITIDGSPSDCELSMKITQNIANNDPRVFAHWSMHEIAMDDYALFAAYDDENLYLMWEMINVSDVVMDIYNLPIFIFISTEKGKDNGGIMVGGGRVVV